MLFTFSIFRFINIAREKWCFASLKASAIRIRQSTYQGGLRLTVFVSPDVPTGVSSEEDLLVKKMQRNLEIGKWLRSKRFSLS